MFRRNHTIFREIIIRACCSVTLSSTDNELHDDGVITPKHVGAILMKISILFLRQSHVHSLVNK